MNAVVISIIEVLVVGFTVWALFNEQRFSGFEDRVKEYFRRKGFKVIKGGKKADKYCA